MKKLNRLLISTLFLSITVLTNFSYANLTVVYDYVAPEKRDYNNCVYMFEPTFSRYTQPLTLLEDWKESKKETYWFIRTEMQENTDQTQFHSHPDVDKLYRAPGRYPIAADTKYTRFAFYEAHALLSVGIRNRFAEIIPRDPVSTYLLRILKGKDLKEISKPFFNFVAHDIHTNQRIIGFDLYKIEKDSDTAQLVESFTK